MVGGKEEGIGEQRLRKYLRVEETRQGARRVKRHPFLAGRTGGAYQSCQNWQDAGRGAKSLCAPCSRLHRPRCHPALLPLCTIIVTIYNNEIYLSCMWGLMAELTVTFATSQSLQQSCFGSLSSTQDHPGRLNTQGEKVSTYKRCLEGKDTP